VSQKLVSRKRVKVVGRGELEPVVPVDAPAAEQAKNRRVEVVIPCPGGR
jgi:flagellar motor protein MotB